MRFDRSNAKEVSFPRDPLQMVAAVYEVGALVFYLVAHMVRCKVKYPVVARIGTQWSCGVREIREYVSIVFVRASK